MYCLISGNHAATSAKAAVQNGSVCCNRHGPDKAQVRGTQASIKYGVPRIHAVFGFANSKLAKHLVDVDPIGIRHGSSRVSMYPPILQGRECLGKVPRAGKGDDVLPQSASGSQFK